LILMLVGLVFRGVAFEFRFKTRASKRRWWDVAFVGGSVTATFFQGVTLGAFLNGLKVVDGNFVGGAFDWISPFAIFTGFALVAAYALLGATWLIMKTEGRLHQRMRRLATPLVWGMLGVIAVLSVWTPLSHVAIAARWFTLPNLLYFSPVPILVLTVVWRLLHDLRGDGHASPFVLTLALLFLGYTGLGISLWPNVIPPDISIWRAAGPPQSLGFALVGALMIIPIIMMYTAWSYWVFRGKVRHGDRYH